MATRRTWALDGTFKRVPAVYCLCMDKDIPTYGFILSKSGITGKPQRQS
ncbi:hypothetical protein T01_3134 [Trichinella spiralis]|uniref:Uncharacterized protein n=1 Tax=Trichinella spiralis TaxID=6334 RepID=A0A0V0YTD7_TRISP|nr:hypothetical protein T01_3134 [Trichinella spiralis]